MDIADFNAENVNHKCWNYDSVNVTLGDSGFLDQLICSFEQLQGWNEYNGWYYNWVQTIGIAEITDSYWADARHEIRNRVALV